MPGPDLSRRVERLEEDVTALSDTVLEIKETVDGHTVTLEAHGRELVAIREAQAEFGVELAAVKEAQAGFGVELAAVKEAQTGFGVELAAMREAQSQQGDVLAEILRRLDAR